MAELVCKVGDHGVWRNGDIISAYNDDRIALVHCAWICSVRRAGFNSDGLRPNDSLARTWLDSVYTQRFERTGRTSGVIIDRVEETETPVEDSKLPIRLAWLALNDDHRVFGTGGREVYHGMYGSRQDMSPAVVSAMWAVIEARTSIRQADYTMAPRGRITQRTQLALKTDNFSDAVATALTSEARGIENALVRIRNYYVDWPTLFPLAGVTEAQVRDPNVNVDVRSVQLSRTGIVAIRA